MARRILVVATAPDPGDELEERVERYAGGDPDVLVVAPVREVATGESPWNGFLVANAVLIVVFAVATILIAIAFVLYFRVG